MSDPYCCNFTTCRWVNGGVENYSSVERQQDIEKYCRSKEGNWKNCKRYHVKEALGFCPENLSPDSELSLEDIINHFEY
ncbi:MAG: hypothetical protein GX437_13335 [Sphingobacteriales bacterium]|nr:hypothetical protein [Sphingobacteriales bacterium]